MDNTKKLKVAGLLTSLAGAIVTVVGVIKLHTARGMLRALWHGSNLYGYSSGTLSGESSWLGEVTNCKAIIAIGIVFIVVGIVLMLFSISKSFDDAHTVKPRKKKISNVTSTLTQTTTERLRELKTLLDNGFITPDEYEEKKKSILNDM